MKLKCLIAICISFIPLITHSSPDNAEYVRNVIFPPYGPYFQIGTSFYRIHGVEQVGGLGSYGRKTGNEFITGLFRTNGYGPRGTVPGIERLKTRSALSNSESITKGYARGHAGKNISGEAGIRIEKDEKYSIVVVRPNDLELFFKKVKNKYRNGNDTIKANFQDSNFRFIDSLVYATDLKIASITNIEGELNAKGLVSGVEVTGAIEGQYDETKTFSLPNRQIVAYSYSRLCWENKQILTYREDDPSTDNIAGCNEYE